MDERPDFEATHGSYWRSLSRRRRWAYVVGSAVFALVAIAAALAATAVRQPAGAPEAETSRTIIPAEETSEATLPALPGAQDAGGDADGPAVDAGDGATAAPVAPAHARAALVSYRRDGWLCVAGEDGAGERRVVAAAAGVHALSPDGATLAYVDAAAGTLALVDVASGSVVVVGPAVQDLPSWAPDSAWLAYTAPDAKVMRVFRDGRGAAVLFGGSMPTVSVADGTVAGVTPGGEIAVWREGGALTRVRVSAVATGLATDGATVYFGAMAADGAASLRAVGADGKGERTLVKAPASGRTVTFGDLLLSHGTARLVYAERSDDGYSRMFAVDTAGGKPVSLCVRRDCYPLRWTADGAAVVFVEGNAIQGDPTALMRVLPSGASRRLLAEGVGR